MNGLLAVMILVIFAADAHAGLMTEERKPQFEKSMLVIFASAMPKFTDLQRASMVRDYIAAKPNKAQAIELTVGEPFRSSEHELQDVAGGRVLEACQLRYGKPCALIAVNEEIAAEGELVTKNMPRLAYKGSYEVDQIPIVRAITRDRPEVRNYYDAPGNKAVAIHPWGTLFVATGKSSSLEAQTAALSACNGDTRRHSRDGPCFLYAIGNNVIISERRVSPTN
jgi:hypothetical protein